LRIKRLLLLSILIFTTAVFAACQSSDNRQVVTVTALDFAFEAPDELPSGWTTFRVRNTGEQEHFLILWRLPNGSTFEDYASQIAPAFQSIMEPYREGAVDRDETVTTLGGLLPEWYWSVLPAGGVGLTAPGGVAQTTVNLEPGHYVMECYVKTPEGVFHAMLGMLHPLTVTDVVSGATAPESDIEMVLTNYEIATEGVLTAGEQVVRVQVMDDPEGLLKHDVHLVRLAEGTGVDDVVAWMDWLDALMAPAPIEFMGGAEDMPAGNTAYITLNLEPGTYAWVSESYGSRGMAKRFTVE